MLSTVSILTDFRLFDDISDEWIVSENRRFWNPFIAGFL
jgi:hypothetical protein